MPYVDGIWKSHEYDAVFDRRRVSQKTIDDVTSPYGIWNNPALRGRSHRDPAYVLAQPCGAAEAKQYQRKLDRLNHNPDRVVKKVYCGN